jgi:malate dehydrogenase (oxaloacetate-decarboxylating)(NADP+)
MRLELQKKKIEKVCFVINGAGRAAMACVQLYVALGAKYENFILFDKDGVLHKDRKDLGEVRAKFAVKKIRSHT